MSLDQTDAENYRVSWASELYDEYTVTYVHKTTTESIDVTKSKMLNLDQLVIDQGGWHSRRAVEGSLILISQNMALWPPWVARHEQTKQMLYRLMVYEHSDVFKRPWSTFRMKILDRDNERNTGTESIPAALATQSSNSNIPEPTLKSEQHSGPGKEQPRIANAKPFPIAKAAAVESQGKHDDFSMKAINARWNQAKY